MYHLSEHGFPSNYTDSEIIEFAKNFIVGKKGTWGTDKNGVGAYVYVGTLRGRLVRAYIRPNGYWASLH
jgi:hypothetical protein